MAIKINKDKDWDKASDEEKVSYCEELFKESKAARQRREWEWYMNYLFLEGSHYAHYNTATNSLERPPRRKGEVRLVVNKIRSSVRAVQNYSTRFHPKWETVPGDIDPETIVNARRSGKALDYLYRHLHLESVVRGITRTALNTSIGVVELGWDDKADGGLGQVLFRMHDPFDIYFDRRAYLYANKLVSRYACKATQKSLDEIGQDKRYDKKNRVDVVPDEDLSTSHLKARLIRREQGWMDKQKIKRSTVKEFYLWDDEKNAKGGYLTLFTYAGKKKLREEVLKLKEYPLYVFQIPQDPLKIYHRSWVADAVPLNKALDRTLSQMVMYVNQALVYRIIAEKGHGVDNINNDQGGIIEINPNRKWEQMQLHPLPGTIHNLSADLKFAIEDTLSAHEASVGQMPAGARAGKIIEALQAAEANNLAGIRYSLESFLSVVGKRALEIIADKYVASRVIKITEPELDADGKPINHLKVIGKGASSKPKGAVIVTGEDEVIVKIGSWLGHTVEAQRETIMEMAERKFIPTEEVLRQFEFPNIEELSKKAREEAMEEHVLKAEIAGRGGEQGGQAGGAQAADPMKILADEEMAAILNGENLPPTQGASPGHIQAEMDFMSTYLFDTAPPDRQQMIQAHVRGEMEATGVPGVGGGGA